jgi:hypothetical protein
MADAAASSSRWSTFSFTPAASASTKTRIGLQGEDNAAAESAVEPSCRCEPDRRWQGSSEQDAASLRHLDASPKHTSEKQVNP